MKARAAAHKAVEVFMMYGFRFNFRESVELVGESASIVRKGVC
jgi:hypothetical protein